MKKVLIGLTMMGVATFASVAQAHDRHHGWRDYDGWHGDYGWHGWHHQPYFHHHHSHVFIGYYPSYYDPYCY